MKLLLDEARGLLRDRSASLREAVSGFGEVAVEVAAYAARRLGDRYGRAPEKVDPLREILDRMIVRIADLFIEVKKSTAVAIADQRRMLKVAEEEAANAAEWGARVGVAERAGDAGLVREARLRQQEHSDRAALALAQAERQGATVAALKETLRAVDQRIERAKRNRNEILLQRSTERSRGELRLQLAEIDEALRVIDRLKAIDDLGRGEASPGGNGP